MKRAQPYLFASLLVLSGGCTQVQAQIGLGHSLADGACLYMKENKIKVPDQFAVFKDGAKIVTSIFKNKKADEVQTPLCEINGPAGVLLASANYIDRATLNAAKGIDSIEKALGMKQTLTQLILELEKALEGENVAAQVDSEAIKATEIIGNRAKEIKAELAKYKDKYLGSEKFKKHVVDSQISLNAANYYQAQTALGIATFRKYWQNAGKQERSDLVSNNSSVGITSDFAENLPKRATSMVENITQAIKLASKINKSLDKSELKKQKAMIKEAGQAESKKAVEVARAIDKRTKSTFTLAKQEDSAQQSAQVQAKSDCNSAKNKITGLFGKMTGKEKSPDPDCL